MNDKFVFYSKSSDAKPGKGTHEHVNNPKDYKDLEKIKDWRKMLSNMYISPFFLDGEEWMSVEHFFHACKFRGTPYYKTFTRNGGKPWSTDPFKAFMAGKAGRIMANKKPYKKVIPDENGVNHTVPTNISMRPDFYSNGIDKKAMTIAQFSKFTQNPILREMLLNTKNADLVHLVTHRGQPSEEQLWTWLMNIRHCINIFSPFHDLADISDISKDIITDILK